MENYNISTYQGIDVNKPPRELVEVKDLVGAFTSKEVRYYISQFRPTVNESYYNGKGEKTPFEDAARKLKLDRLSVPQLLLLYSDCADKAVEIPLTTFNCATLLSDIGFGMDYVTQVDDIGTSLKNGVDGSKFPTTAKNYVKFVRGADTFFCPIVNGMINTNYMKIKGLRNVVFVSEFVESCAALATFFEYVNGSVVNIQASEAGKDLLNFEHFMASTYSSSVGLAISYMTEWIRAVPCVDKRGWNGVSYTGPKFAHQLYIGVATKIADKAFPLMFQEVVNKIFNGSIVNGQYKKFLGVENGKFVITRNKMCVPDVMNSVRMNLMKKEANLDQAYTSLMLSRGFRGVDSGERGALSRTAYFGCNASPVVAETSYLMTNLKRYIGLAQDLIIYADPGTAGSVVTTFLEALVGLDFKGDVFIPHISHVINALKADPHNKTKSFVGSFGSGNFRVISMIDASAYVDSNSWIYKEKAKDNNDVDFVVPSKNAIVYDWRPLTMQLTNKKTILRAEEIVHSDLKARMYQWKNWSFPVISRSSLHTQ